ncbi:MAG: esterase-like activity of phytase family protein [Mycobacterium sp.]
MGPTALHRLGYLGALTVALGIGAALAAEAPTAWADTTGGASAPPANHPRASEGRPAQRVAATRISAIKATTSGVAKPTPAAHARRGFVAPGATSQPGLSITRSGQSPFMLSSGATGAAELSGITYAGGTTYYAVGDNGARTIWQVYTSLDSATGQIRSSLVTAGINAPGMGIDSEGIALAPNGNNVWISDEVTSSINQFSLTTGLMVGSVAVPDIYRPSNVQNNMGLESLSYGQGRLWTANEEALKPDGTLSTTSEGSWVRIQEFDGPNLTSGTQYAYRTDPISRLSPFVTVERSGLVDLLALPNGDVMALERELGGFLPHYRTRIYLVDFIGASDVANVASLSSGGFTAVGKALLWQGNTGFSNFEGITLGPQLSDGSYAVLLVSDNGSGAMGQRQNSFSLTLKGLSGPTPAPTEIAV